MLAPIKAKMLGMPLYANEIQELFQEEFKVLGVEVSTMTYNEIPENAVTVNGFFDDAVALKVLQGGASGLISSTVIDFRVGRILGVACVGTVGDHQRTELATELALALEKRIVRVVLGG